MTIFQMLWLQIPLVGFYLVTSSLVLQWKAGIAFLEAMN